MKYTDITGKTWETDCIGCGIGDTSVIPPGGIISANDSCYLHQDPEVPLSGFLVIGAKRHTQSIADFSEQECRDYATLLRRGRRLLGLVPEIISVTVVQEERLPSFSRPLLFKIKDQVSRVQCRR